jgi:hypothetical protein
MHTEEGTGNYFVTMMVRPDDIKKFQMGKHIITVKPDGK